MKAKKTGGRANRPPVHSVYGLSAPEKPTGFVVADPKGYFILVQRPAAGGRLKEEFEDAKEPCPIEEYLDDFKDTNGGLKCCDLFLHKSVENQNMWEVSNGLTGLRVSTEPLRNRKDAAQSALERVITKGSQAFWDAIHHHIARTGVTQRYRKE